MERRHQAVFSCHHANFDQIKFTKQQPYPNGTHQSSFLLSSLKLRTGSCQFDCQKSPYLGRVYNFTLLLLGLDNMTPICGSTEAVVPACPLSRWRDSMMLKGRKLPWRLKLFKCILIVYQRHSITNTIFFLFNWGERKLQATLHTIMLFVCEGVPVPQGFRVATL